MNVARLLVSMTCVARSELLVALHTKMQRVKKWERRPCGMNG